MRRYNPKEIEPKWQKVWAESGIYKTDMGRTADKYYVIPMLPYPSGDLHIGHWYNFGPTDTVARFRRMLGNNVLTTIGFDAFGLPAENAAIKRGIQPAVWTYSNIDSMTKQIGQIGASYDWDHTLATCKPDYYRWNQWLFLRLYEKGLAYRAKRVVNWCPKDQTVLANEQVIGEDNVCERCGTPVIQKELEQWFFKITDYAERLLDDLETVEWPQKVKTMQQNWIGKSQGAMIDFGVDESELKITVFTTRPDTIFGATYMVLAPEHPLVKKITTDECRPRVEQYIEETSHKTELERKEGEKNKTGSFTGAYAVNPATNKKIPIWIADYVLAGYGTGAIMAVPGHDQRDYEFARKFDLPVKFVVEPTFGEAQGNDVQSEKIFVALRNPKDNTIAVLDWGPRRKNYGGNMLIGGSVEDGEEHRAAAEREITEETGFTQFRLVKEAGFKGHGYFYSNTKDMNVHASGKGFLYELTGEDKVKESLDDGEKDKFTISWQPAAKVAAMLDDGVHEAMYRYLVLEEMYTGEGLMINSGKFNGMDSAAAREAIVADLALVNPLNPAKREYLVNPETGAEEPVFIQTGSDSAVRQDQPFVERQAITALVKHWDQDKYIGLKWKTVDWDTLITGGIEKGQTAKEAAIAEIREETGYKNPVLKQDLGAAHAKFFHNPKNENRFAHFRCLYFELADGERDPVSADEQKNHEVLWLTPEQMDRFRLPDSHWYMWNIFRGRQPIAKPQTNYRLRDWLISRQRYWGTPIPIIYCDKCGMQPVPDKDLPVILPEDVEFELTGRSPLTDREDFVNTKCPNCGKDARRETDTMDTFVDSSWYFLRYLDAKNSREPFDTELINDWMPMDHYIGGIEHAILHLMYARFITKFLHDHHGLNFTEPFKKLTNQGIILGPDGQKMSKSRGNVVNPDEQVNSYGADSLRLYMMFMGPYEQGGPYDMGGIAGTRRFLDRLWTLLGEFLEAPGQNNAKDLQITSAVHKTVRKVTQDLETLGFNTAIAAMMELVNSLYKIKAETGISQSDAWRYALETLTQLLAPFAPHIAEEVWESLGHDSSVHVSTWPAWDEKMVAEEVITLAVQVNGKVRSQIVVPADISEADAIKTAESDDRVAPHIKGKKIKKSIYVSGRLVSLVV